MWDHEPVKQNKKTEISGRIYDDFIDLWMDSSKPNLMSARMWWLNDLILSGLFLTSSKQYLPRFFMQTWYLRYGPVYVIKALRLLRQRPGCNHSNSRCRRIVVQRSMQPRLLCFYHWGVYNEFQLRIKSRFLSKVGFPSFVCLSHSVCLILSVFLPVCLSVSLSPTLALTGSFAGGYLNLFEQMEMHC